MSMIFNTINALIKKPEHPFNLQNENKKTYESWQFERGYDTISLYKNFESEEQILKDKVVLDVGCGAGGKSIYYAFKGAKKVYGIDRIEKYQSLSYKFAEENNLKSKFSYIICDAMSLPFEDETFDTVILNDTMEHLSSPQESLIEIERVLKPNGKIYINFPPYFHPYGAHMSDAISIPWVHLFFKEKTLIKKYKELVENMPDKDERIELRFSKDKNGEDVFSYINHMTIKRFQTIIKELGMKTVFYQEVPLRSVFKIPSKLPIIKEMLVKMVVCVIEKDYPSGTL